MRMISFKQYLAEAKDAEEEVEEKPEVEEVEDETEVEEPKKEKKKHASHKGLTADQLFKFFQENKNPSDEEVHELATKYKIAPDKLEAMIYKILATIINGGESNKKGTKPGQVDQKELRMGMEVELEHVDKKSPYAKLFAIKIALDHLSEMKDYYSKLKEMEAGKKAPAKTKEKEEPKEDNAK